MLLLLEAYFNTLHKINFNIRIMPFLEASYSTPQKIIGGRRSQDTSNLVLSKKLIVDFSKTKKLSTATICADATNCYYRVSHPYDILCVQYFRMDLSYFIPFRKIQIMKMYLRTAFGV